MNPKTRARLLWTMAAVVVAYALLNVIVYFVSGSYGVGWFLASLILYGAVLVVTIVLLVTDRDPAPEGKPDAATREDATTVTITPTGPERAPIAPVIETRPAPIDAPRDAE